MQNRRITDHQILKIDCGAQGRRGAGLDAFLWIHGLVTMLLNAPGHMVGEVKSRKAKTEIGDLSGEGGLCDHLCCPSALSSPLLSFCSPLLSSPLPVFLAFCAALSKGLPQGFGQTFSCCQSRSPSPLSLCLPARVLLSL